MTVKFLAIYFFILLHLFYLFFGYPLVSTILCTRILESGKSCESRVTLGFFVSSKEGQTR